MTNPTYIIPGGDNDNDDNDYPFAASSSASASFNARQCANAYGADAISRSRYLKPTQSLLEEIVNLGGKEIDLSNEKYVAKLFRGGRARGALSLSSELRAEFCSSGIISPSSSSEKQEAQMKLAKLISLLEEVSQISQQFFLFSAFR